MPTTKPADDGSATERPLAYSAVSDPTPAVHPNTTTATDSADPVPEPAPPASPKEAEPVATRTATKSAPERLSVMAVGAFLLSACAFLFPVGLWLGYRTRSQIDKGNGEYGREFATAAIIIGWLWLVFLVLAALVFLWILI